MFSKPESCPPCVIHEDEHLLVVNKPAGMNTHSPSPFAGEGIYDWLRQREPRWASLAIMHRLDKETSGLIVFGKTALANRSLTEQFTERRVRKKYLLLTDRPVRRRELVVKTKITRLGERYASGQSGEVAETWFRKLVAADVRRLASISVLKSEPPHVGCCEVVEASPVTGRTHQIRVHAVESGFPILGDTLYGGSPFARVCLHAAELTLKHPANGQEVTFRAEADFEHDPRLVLRAALIDARNTNAFRIVHGASSGWPGWYVERLGDFLLSQSETALDDGQTAELERLRKLFSAQGVYHKVLTREVRRTTASEASPQLLFGERAPDALTIRENGVQFELSFQDGYSVGLFLDQRDNRRRLLTGHVAAEFSLRAPGSEFRVLNTFAYTCGFSVCAALAGAKTASLDLSKKYLAWGERNFALNGLDPAKHDFIYGDAFDWLRRLAKKQRAFDVVLLDPPTFSQSKEHGVFRAENDCGKLVTLALPLVQRGGILFAATNARGWAPENFLATLEHAIRASKRRVLQRHYFPQPPDFPVSRLERAYLKTVWVRIE
jgi:23S rRNA (cytosine1962-C5)-methyltransferase